MSSNSLSDSDHAEIEKLLNLVQKMEGIVRTTSSEEQKTRMKKDISRYMQKIDLLIPGTDIRNLNAAQIRNLLNDPNQTEMSSAASQHSASTSSKNYSAPASGLQVIDKIKIEAASENCQDNEINMLYSMLHAIQTEYWPALSDRNCQLDFSHSAERDGLRLHLDNAIRHLEVVTETIEEYATAESQDFREQLLKMKNRQTRTFIHESNEALKKIRSFLKKLVTDIEQQSGIISNKDDILSFDSRYENATLLKGYSVKEAVMEFHQLVVEIISRLNLPDIKIKE